MDTPNKIQGYIIGFELKGSNFLLHKKTLSNTYILTQPRRTFFLHIINASLSIKRVPKLTKRTCFASVPIVLAQLSMPPSSILQTWKDQSLGFQLVNCCTISIHEHKEISRQTVEY